MLTLKASGHWTDTPAERTVFGHFIESGFGRQVSGLWSEMLYNRAFREVPAYRLPTWEWLGIGPEKYGSEAPFWHSGYEEFDWQPIGAPVLSRTLGTHTFKGLSSLMVESATDQAPCGLSQDGIHLKAGEAYTLRLFAGVKGDIGDAGLNGFGIPCHTDDSMTLHLRLAGFEADCPLTTVCAEHQWTFTAARTETARLELFFQKKSTLLLAWASLMPNDNLDGWRRDVVETFKRISPPVVRFPGGCFVSFYDWEATVGDRNRREPQPSHYWGGLEENDTGLDEFMRLSELVGFSAQICFNMMSSTPFKARQLVEYLNAPATTGMGRLRAMNGHSEPYSVRYFEMDNEPGRKWTAPQYAGQCVAFSREMRQADPGIELMLAAYTYPVDALPLMLDRCGHDLDLVIYRQSDPDFVRNALAMLDAYNAREGTDLRLVNTEWLPSCHSPEPFDDPGIPTDFSWTGAITNDYRTIFSTQQRSWNYALNGAHRLLDFVGYGGRFALANFNNLCNTWGQNVLEATKDGCHLSCMGHVFAFFQRHFSPCVACAVESGTPDVHALLTRDMAGGERLYVVNHASSAVRMRLPEGVWQTGDSISAPNRMTCMTAESPEPIAAEVPVVAAEGVGDNFCEETGMGDCDDSNTETSLHTCQVVLPALSLSCFSR